MNWSSTIHSKVVRSSIGAALTVLIGLALWKSVWAIPLVNLSFDTLTLVNDRTVTNKVTFIMLDDDSYTKLQQTRGHMWDRSLHTQLLDKLAVDNCAVVILDNFFQNYRAGRKDQDFIRALKRHHEIVLRAGYEPADATNSDALHVNLPADEFVQAAGKNWGIRHLDPDGDHIVRHHWPMPAPGPFPTLAEAAARTAGADLAKAPHERWVRYYGRQPPWTRVSYYMALKEPANFFHEQFVFIGVTPRNYGDDGARKLRTPYSRWSTERYTPTEMVMTEFLNLLNGETLQRSPRLELAALLAFGVAIGSVVPRYRFARAVIIAGFVGVAVFGSAVALTHMTNYWFPWLLVVLGQIPVALVWSAVIPPLKEVEAAPTKVTPAIPGYHLIDPPFGHGAYGKVWLAQNEQGEWRAIKVIAADSFNDDHGPYDREYDGVSRYREICDQHPGLLRVEFVSEKLPTHFYYVMELGDAVEAGWQKSPTTYKPRDLNRVRSLAPQKRLPIEECLRVGMTLCDTLDFLHRSGLTHRDIKPQNILFVNGHPKLADLGLITTVRYADRERTAVGTPGYMPPAPEMPGTVQADIYALGMVLYVISSGRSPTVFPELSETLLGNQDPSEFFLLNSVVLKACQPNPKDRYASAREMYSALEQVRATLARRPPADSAK